MPLTHTLAASEVEGDVLNEWTVDGECVSTALIEVETHALEDVDAEGLVEW